MVFDVQISVYVFVGTPTLYIWGVGDMGWWPRIFSYATSRRGDPRCALLTLLCAFDLSLAEPRLLLLTYP